MFQDISMKNLLELREANDVTVIDVRSPSEYKEATIPGSLNIPFFNDEERAEIGTIYKHVSKQAAKERGLEIVSAKLPAFVNAFSKIDGKKAVFCWRGGMRSRTSATVLDLMGIHVVRLDGGYRTYRNWVVEQFEHFDMKPKVYVLNGRTGSGKTKILNLLSADGLPVLDLEGYANHRGSIFGQIGLDPHNQKTFDALLMDHLIRVKAAPFVLFEGESKRIGKVLLPDFLVQKKELGVQLLVELPIEKRIQHILEDYQPWNHKVECLDAFKRIKRRIHTPVAKQIEDDLNGDQYAHAVRLLLEYYYDPLYDHSTDQYPEAEKISIQAETIDEATQKIMNLVGVGANPA